jgi:hypothetical protein
MLKLIKTILNVRPNTGDKVTTFIGLDSVKVTGVVSQVIEGNERGQGGYCWIDIYNASGRYIRSVTASFSYCWFNYN